MPLALEPLSVREPQNAEAKILPPHQHRGVAVEYRIRSDGGQRWVQAPVRGQFDAAGLPANRALIHSS